MANVIRNVWANAVIFCGHFPDGAEKFTKTDMVGETKGQWYLRQMLGSANFEGGWLLRFMSGNLCHQVEHHLYPDLPSNRLHEISFRVKEVCDKYDLPYTTGSFLMQYGKTWRTIAKLSLPNKYLRDTADDAPETRSERMFTELEPGLRRDGSGHRPASRPEDRDRHGAQWRRDKRREARQAHRPGGLEVHSLPSIAPPACGTRAAGHGRAKLREICAFRVPVRVYGLSPTVDPAGFSPCPVRLASASASSVLSSKSNKAKFSVTRCGVTDFGNTMSPR